MLIANRGSNDVSVLLGTYAANGEWVGNLGPRVHSGGAGPIVVDVRDLNGDHIPDFAVTNGGSGTITMLTGVGQGFFDDRQPQTLFNLGGAVDQPPTFQGTSSVGFAVTATGDLERFDLSHPENGVFSAFAGHHIVAAEALPDGRVVVALADGRVDVLSPSNRGYVVTSELKSSTGTPASLSSLVVLQQAGGQFQVLVSSQGSSIVSVFASAGSVGTTTTPIFVPSASSNGSQAPAGFTMSFAINLVPVTSSSVSESSSGRLGLSLSSFSSQGNLLFTAASAAALVAVEGNNYSTVAVLDFGSQQDDLSGDGRGRRPELSSRFPVGDTSPLTRFVIG